MIIHNYLLTPPKKYVMNLLNKGIMGAENPSDYV
jgi:hypothetical protein